MAISLERPMVVDSISRDSDANWGDEGPVSVIRPGIAKAEFPVMDPEAIKAKRLARNVKDVTVVIANGLQSMRLVEMERPHRNGHRGNGKA